MGTRAAKRAEAREAEREITEYAMPLSRHADHDPELACRPALGAALCYPAPAGVELVPWRAALGRAETG